MTAARIAEALHGRRSGRGTFMCCCPAHEDRTPSLSVTERGGRLLVKCFAGCEQRDVVEALKARGLWPEPEEKPARPKLGPVVAQYWYTNEHGEVLFRVTRHTPKDFRQWRPDGFGGWIPGLGNTRRVLYHLPEVVEAAVLFIVEGEKDVETLRSNGFTATCCPMGAGKWREEFNPFFRGKTVVIIPDNDEPGHAHARAVTAGVRPYAAAVVHIDLEGPKDVSEWFEHGHSEVELCNALESVWEALPHG